ncbi:MAG TPA: SPOR domain-containing protein [Casimicrobiaceae bacterium]|nr:SPOR domain-containing protein [Casimicrobiaceae bacterium]
MADPADLNLDELKRRGRRRLIGAIVLALVAAVVVPMLLESDPRPLGEDVSVRIPPVDDGKFVNKLNEARGKGDTPRSAAPAPAPVTATPPAAAPAPATSASGDAAPRKSLADAEKTVLTPGTRPPAPEPKSPAKATEATKANNVAKAAEPAPPKGEPAAKADAAAKAAAAPATAEPPREGFVVQLAAFSDDKGANALANKLKLAGHPAYTETITTSRGTLWRVRVGGFASRDAAATSRDKLKGEGHAGIVLPAK